MAGNMLNKQQTNNIERIIVENVWQIKLDNLNFEYIWKHFTENHYFAVGLSDVNLNLDLSKYVSSEEIYNKVESSRNDRKIKEDCSTVYTFIKEIKIGDILVVSPDKNMVCGIGVVESDYIPPKKSDIPFYANLIHSRKIRWLYTYNVEVEKKIISNKNIQKLEANKWNKIILSYIDKNTAINILNNLINNYRKDFDYDDYSATNHYKTVSNSFNKHLNEIILDIEKGNLDIDRIYDDIILPRDTIFKDGIQSLKSILKAKPCNRTDDEIREIAIKYIDLMKAFRNETDINKLKILLKEFDDKYSKCIGLARLSASLLYLNLSKYTVINSRSKEGLYFIPRFLNYNFTLKETITDYIEDNENIRNFTKYLMENTLISSYADLDQFAFWLTDSNLLKLPIPIFYSKNNTEYVEPRVDNENKNLIYFGAPGTGKSFKLNKDKEKLHCEEERITFHHDYSYANFVGTYKPIMKKDELGNKTKEITYDYVPGPFIRTLVKAFKNPNKNYLLIIEEINRANVAAVFGDVFQLLDREKEEGKEFPIGASEYPIQTSEDLKDYLKEVLKDDETSLSKYKFEKIWIPENMYLWATMNSADQGVFPMDTAFKRRWDFEYIGVDDNEPTDTIYHIGRDKTKINWNNLRKAINKELLSYNINEDKLLGSHFIPDKLDDEKFNKIFKNKILMYLFEDVGRAKRSIIFSNVEKDENILYSEICDKFEKDGLGVFNENIQNRYEDINKESE